MDTGNKDQLEKRKYNHQSLIRITPIELCKIAISKKKSTELKKKIRKTVGLKQFFWDHTKNYSDEMKYQEDRFINARVNKHCLNTFLQHYIKKSSFYTFLNKIVRKLLKKEKISDSSRKNLWLLFSGAAASILKHPNYYSLLDKNYNEVAHPFEKIIS